MEENKDSNGQPNEEIPKKGPPDLLESYAAATKPSEDNGADFPKGFWSRVDFLLRNKEEVFQMMNEGQRLRDLTVLFLQISLLMAAIYGTVMGGTNLLQGSEMAVAPKLALIPITGLKVPVLFVLTLVIVFPPIYVSNAFAGAKLSFGQMSALLFGSVAVMTTILASMASVAFFFSLTTLNYHFIKLLHVTIFAYAGFAGLNFLASAIDQFSGLKRKTPPSLFFLWLGLYVFVGTQLAWVMRPFIASPNEPFEIFRERSSSFYESVFESAKLFASGEREE